ncbi:MAG: exopolysaccharide biosynthesis polyprenyl glycosylphosphotransferase [Clostridia bacterium]|nr:exopolysaccharide biosynthesis polyprenyl glycosylphosphotransferase [Clostridia bacterium]
MAGKDIRPFRDVHTVFSALDRLLDYCINFAIYSAVLRSLQFENLAPGAPDEAKAFFLIALFCVSTSFFYHAYDVYARMRTRGWFFFASRILAVNAGILFGIILLSFLFGRNDADFENDILWAFRSNLLSALILSVKKGAMILLLRNLRQSRKSIKRVLLVTDSEEMANAYLDEVLVNRHFGYEVIGYVGNLSIKGLLHLGTTGELDTILQIHRPEEVVMGFETVRKRRITKYVSICNDHCIKVFFLPSVCGYFKSPRQIHVIGNLPLIDVRSNPLENSITNRFLKRSLDIFGASLLLFLTSPVMLFTAVGVALSSPGPILFRQTRIGKDSRPFTMYKFRSMRINQSEQTGWSHENDDRRTCFGAFIRRFALDELPQFWNVLKGDMSLVGPRPEVPYYVEIFRKRIPLYMLKHTLRPGITGLAQIKGLRGDTSIPARIEADIHYIENWSLREDLRILLITPFRAFNRNEHYRKQDPLEQAQDKMREPEEAEEEHEIS